jgi:hypothetical protein
MDDANARHNLGSVRMVLKSQALAKLKANDAILDGEQIIISRNCRAKFGRHRRQAAHRRLRGARLAQNKNPKYTQMEGRQDMFQSFQRPRRAMLNF